MSGQCIRWRMIHVKIRNVPRRTLMTKGRNSSHTSSFTHLQRYSILLALLAFLAFRLQSPTAVLADHVSPTPIPDNQTCSQLAPGTTELKVEPVASGVYTNGTLTVTITVRDTASGQVIDWISNIGIDAV